MRSKVTGKLGVSVANARENGSGFLRALTKISIRVEDGYMI